MMHGDLGHWPHKDSRDNGFPMRRELKRRVTVLPTHKVWDRGKSLNQGYEGACVGFDWTAWYNCRPLGYGNQQGNEFAFQWYYDAQKVDAWPGENYEGTSLRAGAKIAATRDYLNAYLWATDLSDLDAWLLSQGPVCVASDWFNSMDYLTYDNFVRVDVGSGVRGGHAYLLYGKDASGIYYFQNSWGDAYADGATFYMRRTALEKLLIYGQLEACTADHINL